MGRTIKDIADEMKKEFMNNSIFQDEYRFNPEKTFDEQFSLTAIETIWIYIVATCAWLNEQLFDEFRTEIIKLIDSSYVTSLSWYQTKALEFQQGDDLIFNPNTHAFGYAVIDESKRVIKNVAVREVTDNGVTKLKIYFSDENKQPVSGDLRTAFEEYIRTIGAAGTHYLFVSQTPDLIRIHLHVYYDPLVLDSNGTSLSTGKKPVEDAIKHYLNTLEYAGIFYASKLIDVLQQTEGVIDVTLDATTWEGKKEYMRKIDSLSGAFVLDEQPGDIIYLIN